MMSVAIAIETNREIGGWALHSTWHNIESASPMFGAVCAGCREYAGDYPERGLPEDADSDTVFMAEESCPVHKTWLYFHEFFAALDKNRGGGRDWQMIRMAVQYLLDTSSDEDFFGHVKDVRLVFWFW